MTSIREQIEAHNPIVAQDIGGGLAAISVEDYRELLDILGREVPAILSLVNGDDPRVVILHTELDTLVQTAHDVLHPAPTPEERLLDAVFGDDGPADEEPDSPEVERGYDEAQMRNVSMHYAVQLGVARLNASSGLDFEYDSAKAVEDAKVIESYLKG